MREYIRDADDVRRVAYDDLEETYRRRGRNDLFAAMTAPDHVWVKNYVVDVGTGVGVLTRIVKPGLGTVDPLQNKAYNGES